MTIREIETTLEDLQQRHDNLNEATLLILLKAAGWEEQAIIDAVAIYRGKHSTNQVVSSVNGDEKKLFQKNIDEPVFVPEVDVDHLLLSHYPNAGNDQMLEVRHDLVINEVEGKEPESLIVEEPKAKQRIVEEPPHNLPVKPYETTTHVWSFARFKSIFFGNSEPEVVEMASPEESKKKETKKAPEYVEVKAQQPRTAPLVVTSGHEVSHVIELHPTPLSRDEYRLVILASIMLLAILLLLGYMYGHGRI